MLQLTNLKKNYGSRIILEIPHLTISQGIFWLKGENGSGKTTLMKIISGIIPFDGTVSITNIDLISQPLTYRKQVAYAEAEPLFPEFLTGKELVQFVQLSRSEQKSRVNELIELFNMSSFIHLPVGNYSSGMLKKLSLLMAFIGNTKLILLDEPLITVEDKFIPTLLALIQNRHKQGVSFIISSHQPLTESYFSLSGLINIDQQTASLTLK